MASTCSAPSPKDVVELLMKELGKGKRTVHARGVGKETCEQENYLIYACPKADLCKDGGKYALEKGSGYTNPFRHLKPCLVNDNIHNLHKLYKASLSEAARNHDGNMHTNFRTQIKASEKEKAMYSYLKLIVMIGIPLRYVENEIIRDFKKYNSCIARKL